KEMSRGLFKRNHQSTVEESVPLLELIPSSAASPREVFETLENKKRLEKAIESLPERERDVFILRYFNYFTLAEIADILNIAVGTVKAHLFHATEKLKLKLAT